MDRVGKSSLAAFALCALLVSERALAGGVSVGGDMQTLNVGQETVITLPGNPSTGYTWRLDTAASEHLDVVVIDDLGYAPREIIPGEPPIVGAPQEQRFRITGKAAGIAKLAFEYVRSWEGKAVQRKTMRVVVQAR